ncbi:hypothetical protein ILYODFUR_037398 [Ilyodon furcidens]|uniref:Uncharacterized protein n=1 Tax=Ilyodon furcidens TaxID=33524 RepID=A0ABV0VKB6_9TELE
MEEIPAIDIQRSPRAQEPQKNHRRALIPHRGHQDPGGGPIPSWGGDRLTAPSPAQTSVGTARTQVPRRGSDPNPTNLIPIRRAGHVQKRGLPGPNEPANQSRHRMKQSQTPNEF